MDAPVVDLAHTDESSVARTRAAVAIDEAFTQNGFLTVVHHGVHPRLVARAFDAARSYFDAVGDDVDTFAVGTGPLTPTAPWPEEPLGFREHWLAYLDALRADSLMQKLVAWELSDPSPQVRRLSDQRARAMGELVAGLRGDRQPAPGLDAPALNAILIGAIQHLVLAGATSGRFSGLALASDADWDRAKAMLSRIVRALDGPS